MLTPDLVRRLVAVQRPTPDPDVTQHLYTADLAELRRRLVDLQERAHRDAGPGHPDAVAAEEFSHERHYIRDAVLKAARKALGRHD